MLTNSSIVLSHDDLEQAVSHWLNSKIFTYDLRLKQKVKLTISVDKQFVVTFEAMPPEPIVNV